MALISQGVLCSSPKEVQSPWHLAESPLQFSSTPPFWFQVLLLPTQPPPFPTPCTSNSGQIRLLAILWMCHIYSHLWDFANVVSWLKHPLFPPPQEPAQTSLLYGPFLGLPPSDQINCHILQAPTTSYILFYYNLPRCISLRYFPPFYSRSMCLSPCTVKCGGNTWVRCTPGSPEGYLSNWRASYLM